MNFYFDENIPAKLVQALAILEESYTKHSVFSTIDIWGRGAADEIIIPEIPSFNCF